MLHVRPEGWKLVPIRADEEVYEMFLTLRQAFEWKDLSKTLIGKPVAGSGLASTGPRINKPRTRKAAA